MAPSNKDLNFSQEPKALLLRGITGPKMAAETPYDKPEPTERKQPSADDYSGLQVVEPGRGLEVAPPSQLPEALPQQHPYEPYAEYKPWPEYSPQQSLPNPVSFPYPTPVTPGSAATAPHYGSELPASNQQRNGGQNPFEAPGKTAVKGRICGLRRMVFWAILAIVVFVIVAAVAIGVGVGLGTRSDAPSTSSTTSPTTTYALPAATATSTAGPELTIVCPTANRTLYSLAGSSSDQKFLVLCGRDYNSCCGASDMYSVNTTTFEGCLEKCGSQEGCVGVGWGNYYGTNTCWLKSAIGEPNWSGDWYSAVVE
ncbi:hypothetical protein VPNG_00596 [Cytospora leucostoma]|uniref:Apple domain-containing protein n=1 Tax=Cytospora leucostoma TaxID=1230097 RepID=A0A423XMI7_9PEZI|nr:hypothetical protein VPNG_00596 [Cytospora leucostoma]